MERLGCSEENRLWYQSPKFKSHLPLTVIVTLDKPLASLSLSFLIYEIGIIIVPILWWGFHELVCVKLLELWLAYSKHLTVSYDH